jgi:nitrogen-specific signal transduction histidine kinase
MGEQDIKCILNSIPVPVFIVDDDVVILLANNAATGLLSGGKKYLGKRGGEALNCLHATENPNGCGHAEICKNCIIRNSVQLAFEGSTVVQKLHTLELLNENGESSEVNTLVSTSPYQCGNDKCVVLTVENVTELMSLQDILPICANCKSIRNDADYWESVEDYFSRHTEVQLSHGICPDCMSKLYGGIVQRSS